LTTGPQHCSPTLLARWVLSGMPRLNAARSSFPTTAAIASIVPAWNVACQLGAAGKAVGQRSPAHSVIAECRQLVP